MYCLPLLYRQRSRSTTTTGPSAPLCALLSWQQLTTHSCSAWTTGLYNAHLLALAPAQASSARPRFCADKGARAAVRSGNRGGAAPEGSLAGLPTAVAASLAPLPLAAGTVPSERTLTTGWCQRCFCSCRPRRRQTGKCLRLGGQRAPDPVRRADGPSQCVLTCAGRRQRG